MSSLHVLYQLLVTRMVREAYIPPTYLKTMVSFFEGLLPSELPQFFLAGNLAQKVLLLKNGGAGLDTYPGM